MQTVDGLEDLPQSANILVVDDDPTIREYVRLHLASANFNVQVAEDGETAYAMAVANPPDLILSDISMPNMDGFQFLELIRANAILADIPIILLTQHSDTSAFRKGMDLGADDFLSKPVRRKELLTSISSRLKRLEGMRNAAPDLTPPPTLRITARSMNAALSQGVPPTPAPIRRGATPAPTMLLRTVDEEDAPITGAMMETVAGTVLFADIRKFTTFSEKLQPDEVVELLNAFFAKACEPILDQNGWVVKFVGDGLIAMFDAAQGQQVSHAERALKAALLMMAVTHRFDGWIKRRFPNHDLPKFSIGVGVHSGNVSLCKMGSQGASETTIIGDTVNVASRLETLTKELCWSIVASEETLALAGDRILRGAAGQAPVKGRDGVMNIVEVTGLLPKAESSDEEKLFYATLKTAVAANTELLTSRRHESSKPDMRNSLAAESTDPLIQLQGYRLLKKLGEGGMSRVFLAEHTATAAQHVLKLISINEDDNGEMLQRFISEYALVSQVDHPNVAKIYTQGFSTAHAYIAMEYFPGGDLRKLLAHPITTDVALAVLLQVAGALGAIHEHGIVHRDLKPDNIMIRADGSLALADFGIAISKGANLNLTVAGEVFGTPAYIAPEQATGGVVDQRADLYALGVMFFELLTGKKPYRASNTQALLYQHMNLPIPDLPLEFTNLQPLVNAMMAKDPKERVQSAGELIDMAMSVSEQTF